VSAETAIILPIPEVETIVGPLRLQYDPSAVRGVPAHITLLYPVCSPERASAEIDTIGDVCMSIETFPFAFTEVRRFPATAYLHPDRHETFVKIISTLMKRWPAYRPYSGAFSDIVPHLTVAHQEPPDTLAAVERSIRPQLPIRCVAGEVCLLTSDTAGNWSKLASYPLATSQKSTR
jgi:2'-5' RNA ligase